MNKAEKIQAVDKLISLAQQSVVDSKNESFEWAKEYLFINRIADALAERTQVLNDSANKLRSIKEDVEAGKL